MLAMLFALAAAALADNGGHAPPAAHATMSADGHYSLYVQADPGWVMAEVDVAGDGVTTLGPAAKDQDVRVDGWTDEAGPLAVTLTAATAERHGITWTFVVEPDFVPVVAPALEPVPPRKGLRALLGRRHP